MIGPAISGQTTWTVVNVPGELGDFASIEEALASSELQDGDWIEVVPSEVTYGEVELNRPVNLRGLPDPSGVGTEPLLTSLTITALPVQEDTALNIERLTIRSLAIEQTPAILTNCKIGNMSLTEVNPLTIRESWISLEEGDQIEATGHSVIALTGNLMTISHSGSVFYADPNCQVQLINNTIVDETGTSEWVLHQGEMVNNILTIPAGRLALFDVGIRSNMSTRLTFMAEGNTDQVEPEALFAGGSDETEAWLPAEEGPAIGAGEDETDIGFTGGPTPLYLKNLPGLRELILPPPLPSLTIAEVGIGSVDLEWESAESVDGFELQVRLVDDPFGESTPFAGESTGTSLDALEEDSAYQFRLRSIRRDLLSDWATSEIVTTKVTPPPAPVLEISDIGVGSVTLEWGSSEQIDRYELQLRIMDDTFGESRPFEGASIGTSLDALAEDTAYQFRLRSVRDDTPSDWTTSEIITTLTPPPAPVLEISDIGVGSVTLEWSSSEQIDRFELQFRLVDDPFGDSLPFESSFPGTTLDALEEETAYQFRLRSVRTEIPSTWATSDIVTTKATPIPPPAPFLFITSVGIGLIQLEWGSDVPIEEFFLEVRQGDGLFESGGAFPPESTGVDWEVAPLSETYQFRLRSTRESLDSEWAESAIVTTPEEIDPLTRLKGIFGEELTAAGEWFESPWFGWFYPDQDNYIYHLNHGSLYPLGDPSSLFMYDIGLSIWLWTSDLVYPSIYFYNDSPNWFLYYRGTSTPQRWFYEYATGEDIREDQF
jgi:hypothetical protein